MLGVLIAVAFVPPRMGFAQSPPTLDPAVTVDLAPDGADDPQAIATPQEVSVNPQASDESISSRLERILEAKGGYTDMNVRTDQGIVFLSGTAIDPAHLEWAEQLAQKTDDVVAVVNNLKTADQPIWDMEPAWAQLNDLGHDFVRAIPLVLAGAAVGLLFYFIATASARVSYMYSRRRMESVLLQQVLASVIGVVVFLIGLYIALKVSGLTRLAVTVLGGTGLVGLALGFAFRDIAENYLASILISLHHPFRAGDLIEVVGNKGFVRRVTTRGTILATLDGDQIHVPNSMVYKNPVKNFTATPISRLAFDVGIGYEDPIPRAQQIAMEAIDSHEATLADPEPLVLATKLGSATITLECSFWFDLSKYNGFKVRSAVLRQVKAAFMENGISMPDEAREIVFPLGVPVTLQRDRPSRQTEAVAEQRPARIARESTDRPSPEASCGEGDLSSDAETIKRHADAGVDIDQAPSLLDGGN